MSKLLAVIKREYVERVRTKMFLVLTILGPFMLAIFTVVPGLMVTIKTGGPTRLAIVDQSGRLYERVRKSILENKDDEEDLKPGRRRRSGRGDELEYTGPFTSGGKASQRNLHN